MVGRRGEKKVSKYSKDIGGFFLSGFDFFLNLEIVLEKLWIVILIYMEMFLDLVVVCF